MHAGMHLRVQFVISAFFGPFSSCPRLGPRLSARQALENWHARTLGVTPPHGSCPAEVMSSKLSREHHTQISSGSLQPPQDTSINDTNV